MSIFFEQLINLKLMLEQTAGQVSGVSPQREGAVEQYEYVGNVQRSVSQSSISTGSWFYTHNEVKKKVFEKLANLMKVAWSGGKKAGFILGDAGYKMLNILPDVALNDYGIFMGDSGSLMLGGAIAAVSLFRSKKEVLEVDFVCFNFSKFTYAI